MICDYEPPHFLQVVQLHQIISSKTWVSETNEKRGDFHDPSYSNWYYMRIPANFFLVKFVTYLSCHGRDFRKCPSDFRRFPTNVRRCSGNFDHFWSHLKDDNLSVFWFRWDTKSSFNFLLEHFRANWIEFSWLIMCSRTVCSDLWVRFEKLSLMREIDVFSPQAWDSRIMHESWQGMRVYALINILRHFLIQWNLI